jgi:hypothetical protein
VRAISLHQPWAALIFLPGLKKEHETRHWSYPPKMHGERIAIHAAKRSPRLEEVAPLLESGLLHGSHKLTLGAFLGTVRLAGCWSTEEREPANELDRLGGNWSPGRFAWALADPRPLPEPVPALGRQGWWTIPDDFLSI